jgi:23S rRNA (adenine2503-C2)-methyltransferase
MPSNLVQFDLSEPAPPQDATPTRALYGMTQAALTALAIELGEPPYRGRQLFEALYRQRAESLDAITTLPAAFRTALVDAGYDISAPRIAQTFRSTDGTERYLIALADGRTVETVWMPEGDGGNQGEDGEDSEESIDAAKSYRRATICVSSQVGCAVRCTFCFTARLGLERHLTPGEIAGQVTAVLNRHQVEIGTGPGHGQGRGQGNPDRINLVFMGMGEPFHNYANFMDAFRLLAEGTGIAPSRMTVSTSGVLPGIEAFAREPLRPRLAISLNAPNDEVRSQIMPITRKWPIAALFEALRSLPMRPRELLTFEYVLLANINDQIQHAQELAQLIHSSGIRAKVNLIVWNPGPEIDFEMPDAATVAAFQAALREADIPAYIRKPRGLDIFAACGQLKRTVESAT